MVEDVGQWSGQLAGNVHVHQTPHTKNNHFPFLDPQKQLRRALPGSSSMPLQARSFVVFQDTPAPSKASTTAKATVLVDSALPTSREKENLHPVTGQQENQRSSLPKKALRTKDANVAPESRILASKPIPVPLPKSRKRLEAEDGKDRELKKRRPLKPSENRLEHGKKRTRKLPKVVEDVALEALAEGFSSGLTFDDEDSVEQAKINSRCYDLTVSPLADVSGAYEKCDLKQSTAGGGDEVCSSTNFMFQGLSALFTYRLQQRSNLQREFL
jgi:hypothetical protein